MSALAQRTSFISLISGGICTGVILALVYASAHYEPWWWLIPPSFLLLVPLLSSRTGRLALVGLCAVSLGVVRTQHTVAGLAASSHLPHYGAITGYVSAHTVRNDMQQLTVVLSDEALFEGKVLVTLDRWPTYAYGDLLHLQGSLEVAPEFEGFSYKRYLAANGIGAVMYQPRVEYLGARPHPLLQYLYRFRTRMVHTADRLLPEPHSSLLVGMLVGVQRDPPTAFEEALRRSGLLHIVVVSGYNMSLVVAFLYGMIGGVGRRVGILLAGIGILSYTVLVGLSVPVLRAAITALLVLFGRFYGRQRHALVLLVMSAALLLFAQPLYAQTASFQLSYAASAGLLLLAGPLAVVSRALFTRVPFIRAVPHVPQFLAESLSATCAALVMVLPLLVIHFEAVSLVSIPANLIAAFGVVVTMVLGPVLLLLGVLGGDFYVLTYITTSVLDTIVITAQYLSSLSWAYYSLDPPPLVVWMLYYGSVGSGVYYMRSVPALWGSHGGDMYETNTS